jgi:branched-chain amino acid aminotransferase
MIVYLNGRFVPEEQAFISIYDRGFLYGDGLFETIRFYSGEPFLWEEHWDRFQRGCEALRIWCPLSRGEMRLMLRTLLQRNRLKDCLVRLTLSRGRGVRGFSPRGADYPTLAVVPSLAPELPESYRVIISQFRLPATNSISKIKHLNKLLQVLARADADAAGVDEALLMDESGHLVEGTATNLFFIKDGVVGTPPLRGILPGTTRAHVLRLCQRLGIRTMETGIRPAQFGQLDGAFLTSSAAEIMDIGEVDGRRLKRSPLAAELRRIYRNE